MKSRLLLATIIAIMAATILPAVAETKLDGTFVANDACPALQSIRKATNPGNVALTPGTSYHILAGNTSTPTHYWITVPGASPPSRWVPVDCGTASLTGGGEAAAPGTPAAPASSERTALVLAASWEPAFCEGQGKKAECQAQKPDSFEATHFALHGLWPQPRNRAYCSVPASAVASDKAHDWQALPAVTLSDKTRAALEAVMPGTQSVLERHEWIVHGSCYGTDQERYFTDAVTAMSALNASPVRDLFATNIGKKITREQIRAAFDTAFGQGAGDRIRVACEDHGGRRLITEITIGLTGTITTADAIGPLILAAAPTSGGCDAGIVDEVGRQ